MNTNEKTLEELKAEMWAAQLAYSKATSSQLRKKRLAMYNARDAYNAALKASQKGGGK